MEQDQYEARLKELFDSFDPTGTGSLGQEELTDLCHMLQLEEVAPSLQQVLLHDNPLGRIHFDQFKEALIDALSSSLTSKENGPQPDCSPEAQPKFIKDGKRYGRRSVPELQDSLEEFDEETVMEPEDEGTRSSQVSSRNCEELWKSEEGEEYEAEGQLRFWNPDDLNASQTVLCPDQDWVEEKLQLICEDLGITRDGHLNRKKLLSVCEQYGFQNLDKEALEDALQNLDQDDTMSLQDFFYEVCQNTKPPTPSSSTPYRQLKRHLSLQPYDESGRRTLTPSAMTGTIGFLLFSKLDDGTGYGSVEDIIDLWNEEGLENGPAILKALDFSLEGKLNLMELTMTLENELLITKNEVYQAALVSFRSEIRHLLERADQTMREKEKLRGDLEKNEKLKSLMASEMDDHHAAIERRNECNLRKLDEEYKERTVALKAELRKEREQIFQQANRQRLELEQELDKLKLEENYLRDRLTLSIKENTRMENELLETTEKLVDCEALTGKLQRTLDNILREKFGDLDPSCVEFFRHEEKLMQVRNEYERQRRELQDRIDELQLELEDYRAQGIRGLRTSLKTSLFDELDNKNAVDYDQGIGSEDCPPLNMSIEAEMAIEQMREQHQREVEALKMELDSKVTHYEENLKEAKCMFEKEQDVLKQKLNDELHKAEEKIRVYKMKRSELETDMARLKEEHQRVESEHRDQMATMEAEVVRLKEEHQRAESEHGDRVATMEADVVRLKEERQRAESEYRDRMATMEAEVVRLKEEQQRAESEHRDQMATMEADVVRLKEERQRAESEHRDRMATMEADVVRLKEEHQRAESEHRDQMATMEADVVRLKEEHQRAESEHRDQMATMEAEVVRLKEEQQRAESEYRDQMGTMEADMARLKEEQLREESEHGDRMAKMEADVVRLKEERQRAESEYHDRMATMEADVVRLIEEQQSAESEYHDQMATMEADVVRLKEEQQRAESEYRDRMATMEADVVRLKEEQQRAESEHSDRMATMEAEFSSQTLQLTEQETVLRSRLEEAKETYHKDKEELVQMAEELEKKAENRLVELEADYEEKRNHLEKSFNEKILSFQEKHELEKLELRRRLLDEHLKEVTEERKKLDTEYSKRISETEAQFTKDYEMAVKKYEQDLMDLKEKFEMDLQDLRDQHAQEKSQWAFEKEELLQESVELQEELKAKLEEIENEKQKSCSEILQQKDLLEKTYKELVDGLRSEKAELQNEKRKIAAEQVEEDLREKIRQLKNDLREELTERDEQQLKVKANVKHLQDALEDLEKKYKHQTEELGSKLLKSEALYTELSHKNEDKRQEMLEEITRLQTIIDDLKDELESLSKVQAEYKLVLKENSDLKNVTSQLQKSLVGLEEEKRQNKSLQAVHEQIVKENVGLLSEISSLQEKLNLAEKETPNDRAEEKKQYVTTLEEKLKNKGEELCEAQRSILVLQETIQKVENHHVAERGILNAKLLESKTLYKEMCDDRDNKRQEMLVEISRLQGTISDLQYQIASLAKFQIEYTAKKKENEDLKKLVSNLQNSSVLLEEEKDNLKNLQKVHEQTIRENIELLSEIAKLQEMMGTTQKDEEERTEAHKPNTKELDRGDAQHLQETIENLAKAHKAEKEELNSKLLRSEQLYRGMCEKSEQESQEIVRLQGKVKELEKEIATLSKTLEDFKVIEGENDELKHLVAELQNHMEVPEDEKDVLKSLQAVHEKTVKENVRLLSEISRLQKKLLWLYGKSNRSSLESPLVEMEEHSYMESGGHENPKVLDPPSLSQYKEALDNVNLKLQNKNKELEDVTKVLCRLEQNYNDVKTENGHFKTQTVLLQEKLSSLTLEYDQVKKAINLEVIPLPELEDTPISIPGLKLLLAVARKENLQLKESLTVLELNNLDAIENNKVLSSEVSWLQKEIQNMEEMAEASLKLEQLYEEAKKENQGLKSLVQVLQEKVYSLEKTHVIDLERWKTRLETTLSLDEHSLCGASFSGPHHQSQFENFYVSAQQKPLCPEGRLRSPNPSDKPEIWSSDAALDHGPSAGGLQEMSPRQKNLIVGNEQKTSQSSVLNKEIQRRLELLRCENKNLKEENTALLRQITSLKAGAELHHQKNAELLETCEVMWGKLESVQNEKLDVEKKVDVLTSEVTELKSRNEQLVSEKEELFSKNSKNQGDIQDLSRRIQLLLKQKDRKDSVKALEEWKEGYKSKVSDAQNELSEVRMQKHILEQENTLLKHEVETKQRSDGSEVTELRNEMSLLTKEKEKLVKEKEALGEELNRCVAKSAKVVLLESKIANLKQEQKAWEQQTLTLKSQVASSQDKIHSMEENLQNVNLQMSRIKSDLRVAQQEKESLKQEVMSLHKQLQNANAKKQVLEMAVHSSGLQNQQKKQYWDDLEQLMEQEQQLLRQENERLQREVHTTKTGLAQSREKVRQLESTIISLKHQKQQNTSSLVKAVEQEKSGLKRECDQLQKELLSANRKISQLSALERDLETIKAENEVLRAKQGKGDDPFMEMLHSSSSAPHSHSQLQQQACATIPREQYLQLQMDRRNQQHPAPADNRGSNTGSPQSQPEQLLEKMEVRMVEVEQKLRIVKMLLQEKVNQLKEQVVRNTRADATIKDLYVENSQLLKALEMSELRHQTAEKKNYLLEEKISGLSKIMRDLTPAGLGGALAAQRRT